MPTATDSVLDVSRNGFSATEVPYDMKGFIANSSSLHLATNTYPKYYFDNAVTDKGTIVVVKPSPTDSATARVLYVDFTKIDDDCDLRNAVVFHATSSEFSKLASSKTDITVASTTLSNIGTPPVYTPPNVTGDGSELTDVDDLDTDNTIDVHADQIEFDQWWSTVTHLIEGEEDIELANATLQKISTYINAYGQSMQNKLNQFNDGNVEFQAKLQEAIQQAQIDAQKAQQQSQIDSGTAALYVAESKKYYDWAQLEISNYIKNNSKMIAISMANQASGG